MGDAGAAPGGPACPAPRLLPLPEGTGLVPCLPLPCLHRQEPGAVPQRCAWACPRAGVTGCCWAGTSASAGERFPRQRAGSMPAAVGGGRRAALGVPHGRSILVSLQPVSAVCCRRGGCEGLPTQPRLHGGSCTYPALSLSVVGASSPGRVVGKGGGCPGWAGIPPPLPAHRLSPSCPSPPCPCHGMQVLVPRGRLLHCVPCPAESTHAALAAGGRMQPVPALPVSAPAHLGPARQIQPGRRLD